MNTIKSRIKNAYYDICADLDIIKQDPSQEKLNDLKRDLDKFFSEDTECFGVIYTSNLDKLFFGLYVMPNVSADQVIRCITTNDKYRVDKYYLELDSRLFGLDLGLRTEEIAALLIHDIGALVNDSTPVEIVKRAIDGYLKDNHEVLKLSNSVHYKEILSFGFRDALRKYTTIFEKSKSSYRDTTINDFIDWVDFDSDLDSAFDKIDKMGFNYNREVDNKFLTLSWVLRIYRDIAGNRIPAIKVIQKCQDLTPSQIEKKELNNMLRRINRIDDDALLESVGILNEARNSLYKKTSLPLQTCTDKLDDMELRYNFIDNEPDVIPDLIHSVNNHLSIIDDYISSNINMNKATLKQWNDIYNKTAKFRKKIEKRSAGLYDPQIKMHNTWKAQIDQ